MERKIISISGKRQITIPQRYFDALGFDKDAECILNNNAIIIRPVKDSSGSYFAEQILADLISQGFSGQELLVKFKEVNRKIPKAIDSLLREADSIARGERKGASMDDIFGKQV